MAHDEKDGGLVVPLLWSAHVHPALKGSAKGDGALSVVSQPPFFIVFIDVL